MATDKIPPLILGTFQFKDPQLLHNIVDTAYQNGVSAFDTSPSYNTEKMLGDALSKLQKERNIQRENLFIQTKIDGWQMEKSKGKVAPFVFTSLKNLNIDYIDTLFIHWPFPEYLQETWESFIRLKEEGIIKNIGLSNVRTRHMDDLYHKTNTLPDIIQIECHPLRTCQEEINYCQKKSIHVEAYSPVCRMDERLLHSPALKEISHKYSRNIGQIILRWHIEKKVIPVFMSSKPERIVENTKIFDFQLDSDEIELINQLNENYKIFVESICCPGI